MIWSARKQYYLGFWAFLELKSVNILIKTVLYSRRSVDISFLHATFMKIGENDSTHENVAGKFEIQFYFIFLMIYTYKLLKAFPPKHL